VLGDKQTRYDACRPRPMRPAGSRPTALVRMSRALVALNVARAASRPVIPRALPKVCLSRSFTPKQLVRSRPTSAIGLPPVDADVAAALGDAPRWPRRRPARPQGASLITMPSVHGGCRRPSPAQPRSLGPVELERQPPTCAAPGGSAADAARRSVPLKRSSTERCMLTGLLLVPRSGSRLRR